MFKPYSLKRLIVMCTVSLTLAEPAIAAGGNAIGKVADDVTSLFNKFSKPEVPPKTPDLDYRYDPPEYVPGGSTTFSTGRITGVEPPSEGLSSTFNRQGGDAIETDSLSDTFNSGAASN
ncbi:hypothetical protein [uncultured Tateyamaria sp.]|uniref:hypothetical protein n=1 Tax=uncultured Tateyamaria sp. TaxID=455651 RepID=UPI00261A4CF4|nr:hypothetical protein [uncultured Tateyamaria sp.]